MTRIQKLWYFRTWAEEELRRRNGLDLVDVWCWFYFKNHLDYKLVVKFNAWFKNVTSNSVSVSETSYKKDDRGIPFIEDMPSATLDPARLRHDDDSS